MHSSQDQYVVHEHFPGHGYDRLAFAALNLSVRADENGFRGFCRVRGIDLLLDDIGASWGIRGRKIGLIELM